jgi:hypothetical protein
VQRVHAAGTQLYLTRSALVSESERADLARHVCGEDLVVATAPKYRGIALGEVRKVHGFTVRVARAYGRDMGRNCRASERKCGTAR